jgi:phosphatidylglycerol---prolipoprotein diacylglyceryl transferase
LKICFFTTFGRFLYNSIQKRKKIEMYPDFSYILHDLFGTATDNWASIIKTFGLLLALSFLTSAYFLYLELQRKKDLFPMRPMRDDQGNLVDAHPHQRVGDITIIAAISGILGAKILAIFESASTLQGFLKDPIHGLFSGSGLAIYGGLIGGFIGVYLYITKYLKMNPLYMMDAVAPALMFGYAVGRIGCQLSGDGDWGINNVAAAPSFIPEWLWAWDYPRNVMNEGIIMPEFTGIYRHRLATPVYPTPIYETVLATLIGTFLWQIRKKVDHLPGMLFMIYAVLNGVERFFIEKIRVNDKIDAFGMRFTQAELIAVMCVVGGLIGAFIIWKKKQTPLES